MHVDLHPETTMETISIILNSFRKVQARESVMQAINFNLFSLTRILFFFTLLKC